MVVIPAKAGIQLLFRNCFSSLASPAIYDGVTVPEFQHAITIPSHLVSTHI